MQIVSADARRVTTTPNATMTTLASPTLGQAASSLWWVEMGPGAEGPEHAFASEVVWTLTLGTAVLEAGGSEHPLSAGDTAVLPGGVQRRLVAGPDGFTALVTTAGPADVIRADGVAAGTPPWVA